MNRFFLFCASFILVGFSSNAQIIYDNQFPVVESSRAKSLNTTSLGYISGGDRLLHTDFDGNEIFNVEGVANGAHYYAQDSGFVCVFNVITGGNSPAVTAHVKRLDKYGNEIWVRDFVSGYWRNFAEDVVVLYDGMMVYTGRHQSVTGSGAVIRKLCPGGGQIWETKWSSGSTVSTYGKEVFLVDTHLYVIGNANASFDGLGTSRDMFVSKHGYDNGALEWSHVYSSDSIDDATDLLVLDGNSVLLLGNSNGDSLSIGDRGVLANISYDSQTGATTNWVKNYEAQSQLRTNDIESHPEGGYLILGTRASATSDSIKTFIMAVDTVGEPTWEYVFANTGSVHVGREMLRESSHVYVVSGYYLDVFGNEQYYQTKFDLTDLESLTSIEEREDKYRFHVYPNPTVDLLTIKFNWTSEIEDIAILDSQGRTVHSLSPLSTTVHFDCSHLAPGLYYVKAMGKSGFAKQFVVQ